jgi:hypothetical protein
MCRRSSRAHDLLHGETGDIVLPVERAAEMSETEEDKSTTPHDTTRKRCGEILGISTDDVQKKNLRNPTKQKGELILQ